MCRFSQLWALVLILAGTTVLLDNFGVLNEHYLRLWPLWLVVIGVVMLIGRLANRPSRRLHD